MLAAARRHLSRHIVGYLALAVALGGTSYAANAQIGSGQIANGGVKSADIGDGTIVSADLQNGGIRGVDVARGTLGPSLVADQGAVGPAGAVGLAGSAGPRGPRFGDGKQLPDITDVACGTAVSVGSLPVTVTETGRIWASGHSSLVDDGSGAREFGLWFELRDATDATTLAVTAAAWDDDRALTDTDDAVMPLAVSGVLQAGNNPEIAGANPFAVPPGTYVLHLMLFALPGPCATNFPDFGVNQASGMNYMLLAPTA